MVRKHYLHWSVRSTRSRPKTPAPKGGWIITDLSRITGIPLRRLRYYVEKDFIRPLAVRGTATRYPRAHLLRLLAITTIRSEKTWKLDALKREIERMGEAELERLVTSKPLTPEAKAALGIQGSALTAAAQHSATHNSGSSALVGLLTANNAVEKWHHVELLPGLKLLLSSNASSAARAIATKICNDCRSPAWTHGASKSQAPHRT